MRFLALALVLMMVRSCLAADKKTLLAKMNMEAKKPLFDDEKVVLGRTILIVISPLERYICC